MEQESGAKIAIRGKGSVKEGKGKSDAAHASNQDEDLHCLIMADTEEKVNKAKKLIHNVVETVSSIPLLSYGLHSDTSQAASIPEGQNELKRNQLRELAALNGTLRDDENQACQNCGEIGHRKYDCPQARNFTAGIICRVCGNAGHMARDCPDRARGSDYRNLPARAGPNDAIGGDYEKLMNELGGGTSGDPSRQIEFNNGNVPPGAGEQNGGGAPVKPWERQPTGAPAPWASRPEPTGAPAPWLQNRGGNDGGYNGGGGGGGGYNGGYNSGPPAGGPAPWLQNRNGGGGGGGGGGPAPWQQQQQQQQYRPQQDQGYGGGGGYGGGAPGGSAPWQSQAPPPPPEDDVPPPPPPPQ